MLAISFGLWSRDHPLLLKGLRAVAVSTVLAVAAGAVVGLIEGEWRPPYSWPYSRFGWGRLWTTAVAGVGAYAILHFGSGRGWGSPASRGRAG